MIKALDQINGEVILVEDKTNYMIHRKLKPRMVDPLVWINDEFKQVSELSTTSTELIKAALQKLQKGIYLRVESK